MAQKNKRVSDAAFEYVKARFVTKGVVDLAGIAGCCTLLVMQLNSAQYEIPKAQARLKRQPEQRKRERFTAQETHQLLSTYRQMQMQLSPTKATCALSAR